jgi:uncharacterized protein
MIIEVSTQLKEPIGSRRHYRVSDEGELPVEGEVDLVRTERGIYVSGDLKTKLEAVCSRCLTSFELPLTLKIGEEYLSKFEEGCFSIDEGGEIDLREAVRQYMLLAMPMKPLCRRNCAGLCANCGRNLNLGVCDCPDSDIDPRLAVLAHLQNG